MNDKEYLSTQKLIIHDLLKATIYEYSMIPGKNRGEIIIGANRTVLSFRNSTKGFFEGVISELYPLESLMKSDVFELHSFHNKECTFLKYEHGERTELHIYPDTAQDGLLIHVEWEEGMVTILTEDDVVSALKTVLSKPFKGNHLNWKPEVWFNGNRVKY